MKIKLGSLNIKLCQGITRLFKVISKPTTLLQPFIGWYDPGYTNDLQADTSGNIAAGDTAIFYWNGAIDRYNPSGEEFNVYSKESYITALNNILSTTSKNIIVQLPYWDVSGSFENANKLTSWWPDVINATKNNNKVIGYYLFDEPEVWGSASAPNIPQLTHTEALSLYNVVKANTTKDAYAVFTDVQLFNFKPGGNEIKYGGLTPFWDVFMFDAYDFLTQAELDIKCAAFTGSPWCYTAGSTQERDYVKARLLRWKNEVINEYGYTRVVFVMQGHGDTRQDPVTGTSTTDPAFVFGMRTMTDNEYDFIIDTLKDEFNLEGLLVWSWVYANNVSRERANTALLKYKN